MKMLFRFGAGLCLLMGLGLIIAWSFSGAKPGKLDWNTDPMLVRDSLMSFAYKVYANPDVAEGRYFLSKLILKNTGGQAVRDLSVSYQVPGHIAWTTPEVTKALPAGGTLVKLYYPRFTEEVTRLANKQTATLEVRLQWRESENGPLREEVLRDNFTLLGVNELQYSDLPGAEIATWYDNWTMAQFMICMVTPNDPVVKEYAAAITERTGGSMAGVTRSPEDVVELMKATYAYMIETGMRYAGAKGVPEQIGDETKLVQTVRLPRDVITSNNGLCIELALLWASILDHLGCESYIVMRPGHAFTVVMAEGQMFPIECTAITPKAVGQEALVPFEKAVEMAARDLQEQQLKMFYPVQQYQQSGYASPELAPIDLDKIKKMLTDRKPKQQAQDPVVIVNNNLPTPQGADPMPTPAPTLATGMTQFSHQQGYVSFQYPQQWIMQPPVPSLGNTFSITDPTTQAGVQIYEIPGASNTEMAVGMLAQAFAQLGMEIEINGNYQQGAVTIVEGGTYSAAGYFVWRGAFRPVSGGVIAVALGAPQYSYASAQPILNQIFNTIQFP